MVQLKVELHGEPSGYDEFQLDGRAHVPFTPQSRSGVGIVSLPSDPEGAGFGIIPTGGTLRPAARPMPVADEADEPGDSGSTSPTLPPEPPAAGSCDSDVWVGFWEGELELESGYSLARYLWYGTKEERASASTQLHFACATA